MRHQMEVTAPGWLREMVKAVDKAKPDKADVENLRQCLKERQDVCTVLGDLSRIVQDDVIKCSALGHSLSTRLALDTHCQHMRVGLGFDTATPLEKMLIEGIILAWLRLHDIEARYQGAQHSEPTFDLMQYYEKRLNYAQRRYLRAVETLVKVRNMNLIALQVNIGRQQVIMG